MDILQHVVGNVSPGTGFTYHSSTPLYTAPSHPLIEKLGSLNALPVGAPWFCDAAVFSAAGMPAIALGPGSITQAHTADEWIKVSDLEAGADFFEKFLRSLG
jgi:acetylornithine deacetylase/succinyl-diaminopimelate desuccinylase-like protein